MGASTSSEDAPDGRPCLVCKGVVLWVYSDPVEAEKDLEAHRDRGEYPSDRCDAEIVPFDPEKHDDKFGIFARLARHQ